MCVLPCDAIQAASRTLTTGDLRGERRDVVAPVNGDSLLLNYGNLQLHKHFYVLGIHLSNANKMFCLLCVL